MNNDEQLKQNIKNIKTMKEFIEMYLVLDDMGMVCTDGYYKDITTLLSEKAEELNGNSGSI